ncbi:MAG: hypothetical protein ACLQDM_14760 [Bradyrhizobium sp.]
MSEPVTISVRAVVDNNERAAVSQTAMLLESSLGAASGRPVTVRCQFAASLDALQGFEEPGITVISLLPEVANYREPWAEVEKRLRQQCQALMSADGAVVFLCTVFRHVATGDSADPARLVRIRRLDLLAAELSRETGLFIVDLDRSLADIGASKLHTDYRLAGECASEAAGKFIALAVLSAGLDAYLPFEVQDAARATVANIQLNLSGPMVAKRDMVLPSILKLGQGRRKQVVATVVDTDKDSHAGWLIHLMMTGQFGIRDAFLKLRQSVARRGLRSSMVMVLAAARQALRSRTSVGK